MQLASCPFFLLGLELKKIPTYQEKYYLLQIDKTNQSYIIDEKINALNKQLNGDKGAAQVLPFQKVWDAENYHQNYERNNPDNPYIQNVSIPRLNRFKEKFPELLKKDTAH